MKRRIRVAAASSLLALGALGLIACGGGDDETVTGEVLTVPGEEGFEKKSCGMYPPGSTRWKLVVEGDISCREARRVMRGFVNQNLPPGWYCSGPEGNLVCTKAGGTPLISATL